MRPHNLQMSIDQIFLFPHYIILTFLTSVTDT